MKRSILFIVSILLFFTAFGQKADRISGKIMVDQSVVAKDAIVRLLNTSYQGRTNAMGEFYLDHVPPGAYIMQVSLNDIEILRENIHIDNGTTVLPTIYGTKNNYYLDGVTVYGYRRNKFLERDSSKVAKVRLGYMENPQSYSNVNKELMKEQLTTDLSEAVKNVVGMVKVQGSPGRASDGAIYYNLRGFPTKIGLVDGLPANTNGEIDPADVERIEVIKGPSGTLYGGAATSFGGLVNLVTKKPKDYYGGQVSYLFGSYNLNRLTADVFGPITNNRKTLFRLNTAYQYQNGFRDSEFRKSFFVAPTFSYEVNDRLTFNLGAQIYNYEGTNTPLYF